jgi:hypothetical protein
MLSRNIKASLHQISLPNTLFLLLLVKNKRNIYFRKALPLNNLFTPNYLYPILSNLQEIFEPLSLNI